LREVEEGVVTVGVVASPPDGTVGVRDDVTAHDLLEREVGVGPGAGADPDSRPRREVGGG
jgi:hypothetical protein